MPPINSMMRPSTADFSLRSSEGLGSTFQRREFEMMALAKSFETSYFDAAHRPLHRRVIAIAPCPGHC